MKSKWGSGDEVKMSVFRELAAVEMKVADSAASELLRHGFDEPAIYLVVSMFAGGA